MHSDVHKLNTYLCRSRSFGVAPHPQGEPRVSRAELWRASSSARTCAAVRSASSSRLAWRHARRPANGTCAGQGGTGGARPRLRRVKFMRGGAVRFASAAPRSRLVSCFRSGTAASDRVRRDAGTRRARHTAERGTPGMHPAQTHLSQGPREGAPVSCAGVLAGSDTVRKVCRVWKRSIPWLTLVRT